MSISTVYASSISVVDTLTGAYLNSGDSTVTVDQLSETGTLTASTTPATTKHAAFDKTLSSGAGTIDLTSMPGKTADETVTITGLKVQLCKIKGKSTNANKITVTFGASNPYNLLGAAFAFDVLAGQSVLILGNNATPTVGGSAKTIDLAGTGSQILQFQVVAG